MRAAIAGWGTALPDQRLTNAELERRVDTSDRWIVERTGIRERRVVSDGETTASLAIEAGAVTDTATGQYREQFGSRRTRFQPADRALPGRVVWPLEVHHVQVACGTDGGTFDAGGVFPGL